MKDYKRESGQRTLDDDRLAALIKVITRHRMTAYWQWRKDHPQTSEGAMQTE